MKQLNGEAARKLELRQRHANQVCLADEHPDVIESRAIFNSSSGIQFSQPRGRIVDGILPVGDHQKAVPASSRSPPVGITFSCALRTIVTCKPLGSSRLISLKVRPVQFGPIVISADNVQLRFFRRKFWPHSGGS